MKTKRKSAVEDYNAVLDFCRHSPQRKYNIAIELDIENNRLSGMLSKMKSQGLIIATPSPNHAKCYEYQSLPDAVYEIQPRTYECMQRQQRFKKGIVRVGNVTTVSSNSYHSTGSSEKRSPWIGSSADML